MHTLDRPPCRSPRILLRHPTVHKPPSSLVPVFANGYHSDIEECLQVTGADDVMSAEGQLYNASLFAPAPSPSSPLSSPLTFDTGLHLPYADLALEYLHIVQGPKTKMPTSAIKNHLFKLMWPALSREMDLRSRLAKVRNNEQVIDAYIKVVEEMKIRMEVSLVGIPTGFPNSAAKTLVLRVIARWKERKTAFLTARDTVASMNNDFSL